MTTWLITGASSGLGRALAGHVLATGHQVVATARNTSVLEGLQSAYPDAAMVAPVDVTDASSIDAAVTAAEQRFHGIDVLVNNAGYGYTAGSARSRLMRFARWLVPSSVRRPAGADGGAGQRGRQSAVGGGDPAVAVR
jgi:NADP-dependent 3-hydroxy acid dehydrogenase YdfG